MRNLSFPSLLYLLFYTSRLKYSSYPAFIIHYSSISSCTMSSPRLFTLNHLALVSFLSYLSFFLFFIPSTTYRQCYRLFISFFVELLLSFFLSLSYPSFLFSTFLLFFSFVFSLLFFQFNLRSTRQRNRVERAE